MSSTHTPGKLAIGHQGAIIGGPEFVYVNGRAQKQLFMVCVVPDGVDGDQESNGRRLVACWNACDGVPVEVLEANQAGGLPWNVGERIDDKVTTERRMQALVDALAAAEAYIAERVIGTGGTGEREVLPALRRAIEGSPVKPTQTSWGDC